MWLTRAALAHPIAVTLFYVATGVVGFVAFSEMGRSVLPAIEIPSISITAAYSGASPSEIERLVVEPIEDALDAVPNVERVSATAQNGFAVVVARFHFGVSLQTAQSDVQNAVDGARANMPADLLPPLVERDDPSQIPVLALAVSSAVLDRRALTSAVDRTILPALRSTPGVGTVRVAGESSRTLIVEPRPAAMDALGATNLDLFRAMQGAYAVFGGGSARVGSLQTTVGIRSAAESAASLAAVPVPLGNASAVQAGALATMRDGFADPTTIASYNGTDAIVLYVTRAQGADTIRTIRMVRRSVANLAPIVPLARIEEFRSDEPFTQAALAGVQQTLLEGVVLTVLVMLVFLRSWRNAAVAALAIPSSLFATFIAMWALGFTIDVLSLMGLSMTIGILVDDSIVIVEAIVRARERGLRRDEAALAGRSELGGAAIAITLVDVVVFAPIALMSGIVGEFMREFAAAIVIATAFSLLVSFTLTPLLCARWAGAVRPYGRLPWTLRNGVYEAIARAYRRSAAALERCEHGLAERYASRWLPAAWRHRTAVLVAVALACAASFIPVATSLIPTEFSPPVSRGEVTIDLSYAPGTTIAATDDGARRFARRLLEDPRIASVVTTTGRGFDGSTDVFASNLAEIGIELADPTSMGTDVARFAKTLGASVPGAVIAQTGRGMGGVAPIAFTMGGDPAQLARAGANVASLLRNDPLADDVRRSDVGVAPHLELRVDDGRAQAMGLSAADIVQTARIATGGALASRVRTPDGSIDLVVRSADVDALRRANVRSNSGVLVPLSAVLTFGITQQPLVIERENRARIVSVTANPRDNAPIGAAMAPVAREIPAALPPGTFIERRGDLEQFLETVTKIVQALGLSMLLVYAILAVLYRSYRVPLVVMTTVPLASIGAFGLLAVLNTVHLAVPSANLVASQTLNLYSMLGIVMLVGLVAKNGILLVEFAEREVRSGVPALAAMQSAARRRFRPILMTTIAMICGMLPLALGESAGAEYRKALGTVVIGGLCSSLVLTFFLVPIAYVLMHPRKKTTGAAIAAPVVSGEFA